MSIEETKKIAEAYFDAQRSGDLFQGLALMSDDVQWHVPGDWEMAGTYSRAQVEEMIKGLNQFDGGLSFEHQSVTAEDDRVAVLTKVTGTLRDGRVYKNTIFFLFVIRDGKIVYVTEVPDSAKSRQFWLGK